MALEGDVLIVEAAKGCVLYWGGSFRGANPARTVVWLTDGDCPGVPRFDVSPIRGEWARLYHSSAGQILPHAEGRAANVLHEF
jgi:hypothetical protein